MVPGGPPMGVPPPGMPPAIYGAPPMPPHMAPMHGMPPRPPFGARMRGPHPGAPKDPSGGPSVTVFVGNITERAQDAMIRHLLQTCGPVVSWKRVQGATGRLQAFGFCEYSNPGAALRAIRILHDWEVCDKKLVVKVDAKTKDMIIPSARAQS